MAGTCGEDKWGKGGKEVISEHCMERLRWMDQVEEDLKRMEIIGWRAKVEDRQEWNRIVEQTDTHPEL